MLVFKKSLIVLLMIAPLLVFSASKGTDVYRTVQGKVLDPGTQEELTGVKVRIEGTDLVAYTNEFGEFELSGFLPADIDLTFSFISFERKTVEWDASNFEPLYVFLEEK